MIIMDPTDKFNRLLSDSGMSLVEFSEFFNIPYKTLIKWKNGHRDCSSYLLDLMEYKLRNEGRITTDTE